MKYAYLENTTGNHNKFYEMIEDAGGKTFTAQYGRIGNTPQRTVYPMSNWHKIHDEKLKKGYIDKTFLKNPPKPKFVINQAHLEKVDRVLLILTANATKIEDSTELIRDVSMVRAELKDPKSKNKGNLDADDMIFLNGVWKNIKHFANKS